MVNRGTRHCWTIPKNYFNHKMQKKILWILIGLSAILIGLYPISYFLLAEKFGLLNTKTDPLLLNTLWRIGFYTHIIFGGLALGIGWLQFNTTLRTKKVKLHRFVGKVYIAAVLLSATSGIGIGFFATGGWITALGFIVLGFIWLSTTLLAYTKVKKGQLILHQKFMIYSYAACFAAVTLRIWLPLLIFVFGDFMIAYPIVAWLSWVPNLVVAHFLVRRV